MIDDHGQHAAATLGYAQYARELINPISRAGSICWPPEELTERARQAAADKLREDLKRALSQVAYTSPMPTTIINKPLAELTTVDLVMEMLKRGFAVMKLPEDGGCPEVLK